MASASETTSRTRMRPPHFRQRVMSMAKMRASFAHAMRRGRGEELGVGQNANFGTSDPAMIIAVPTAQFRSNYLFYAQTGWQANYVDIIAPDGTPRDREDHLQCAASGAWRGSRG